MTGDLDKARQARRCLEKVRRRLVAPSVRALVASARDLADAANLLTELEQTIRSGARRMGVRRALELEMDGLRRDLKQVTELAEGAGRFLEGWARLISADSGPANYTMRGEPCEVIPIQSKRLVVHG